MKTILNAYFITNATELQWNVASYNVQPVDRSRSLERGEAKQAMWEAKKAFRNQCPGRGFVIDISRSKVIVPATWRLASDTQFEGLEFTRGEEFVVTPGSESSEIIFKRIINEGIRQHFKANTDEQLGTLWQDYNAFCEIPYYRTGAGFAFCRRYDCDAKPMGHSWAVRFAVSTASIDGKSIAEHYAQGNAWRLAKMVNAKAPDVRRCQLYDEMHSHGWVIPVTIWSSPSVTRRL